jgi:hypothetical protein
MWFGGIVVIFSGDFYQFPPVGGSPLYTPISMYAGQSDEEIQKRLGRLAWKSINTIINLTEQQRMKDDPEFGDAVSRLCERRCTEEDVELFNTRVIRSATNLRGIDMGEPQNCEAAAIVSTNALREVLNAHKASTACPEMRRLVVCAALDKTTSRSLTRDERDNLLKLNMSGLKSANPLPGHVTLYEGMPVILRVRNLSTDLGITNGAQGIVRKIWTDICPSGFTYARCVLVHFPDSKVQLSDLPGGYYPIVPSMWKFTTTLGTGTTEQHKLRITRYQVPIQPAFAVTAHSAQGKTLPRVLVNLHEGGFAAYVAASRARSREGLCLTRPVSIDELNRRIPIDLAFENRRFHALEHNTLVRLGLRSGGPIVVPDAEGENHIAQLPMSIAFHGEEVVHTTKKRRADDSLVSDGCHRDPVHCPTNDNRPSKRSRSNGKRQKTSSTMSEEASSVPTWSALAGCKWSATDWSCAYDITFMILFSMYREATSQWSTSWSGENPIQRHLLSSFQTLLHPPTHHSSLRFDQERDSFRDLLSLYDPRKFPRTGSQLALAEAILEYVCTDNERMLQKVDMADQSGATRAEVLTFTLPTYCGPLHRNEQERTCLSLDIWLQMWFERQNAKLNHSPTPAIDTQVRVWRTLLCSPPSFLYFSLAVRQELVIEPSVTFTLPCGTGKAVYKLAGIVYFGGLHFTARLFTNEGELEYDSQTNDGRPHISHPHQPNSTPAHLTDLNGRPAHLYVYQLREMIGT